MRIVQGKGFQVAGLCLSLSASFLAGVMLKPTVDKTGTSFPSSVSNLAPGTYYRDVLPMRLDDNLRRIVRVKDSLIETPCLGRNREGQYQPAVLKYDGNTLSCFFR